jgi:restriction endonuclease Mrr
LGSCKSNKEPIAQKSGESNQSETNPEETLETACQELKDGLVLDLIDAIKQCTSEFFEQLVIDGRHLADLMIENNVGVNSVATYEIKKVDSDYFIED